MKTLVISVETNGLDAKTRDVLKIGIVILDGLLITKKIERWYYPKKYPYYIPEINEIDESVIKEKRTGTNYAKLYEEDDTIAKEIEEAIGGEEFGVCGINVGWQIEFAKQNEKLTKVIKKSNGSINLYKKDIRRYRVEAEDKAIASAQLSVIYTLRKKILMDFNRGMRRLYEQLCNISLAEAISEMQEKQKQQHDETEDIDLAYWI